MACPGGVLWVLKHPARVDPKKKIKEEEQKNFKKREGKKERKVEREGIFLGESQLILTKIGPETIDF